MYGKEGGTVIWHARVFV